jgi:hypothetical protein
MFPHGLLPALVLVQGVVFAFASIELVGTVYFCALLFLQIRMDPHMLPIIGKQITKAAGATRAIN